MAQGQPAYTRPMEPETDPSRGLSSSEAAARLSRYGPNRLAPREARWSWLSLLRPLSDPMVLILLIAGTIFILLGDMQDGAIMLVAIVPVIVVDMVLEVRAERTLERLRELASPRATVRRDGRVMQIPSEEVVPGDVLLLSEGEVVTADGVVHSESNLQLDESALTGESLPVAKVGVGWPAAGPDLERPQSRVYAGTTVMSGRATVIVTATGERTEYGRIGLMVAAAKPRQTPLQRAITGLVRTLGVAAVAASLGVAALELVRGSGWTEALLAAVSLAIAAIPEEFAVVFALYLTLGAWRMARRNALVRRLDGVETLGSTTVVCTDKTGTLTEGRLTVGGLCVDGELHLDCPSAPSPAVLHLLEVALLASEPGPLDPLDQAIASVAKVKGINTSQLYTRWTMVQDYPFDPHRKYVTHIWRGPGGGLRLCSKGSIEGILELSMPSDAERETALKANEELTGKGMRVIAVGEKEMARLAPERWANEAGMRLVGLIGFTDPLREGVRQAIAECQTAGVRVIMITGDHPLTAHAVAESAGLYHHDQEILTGPEVERLSDRQLERRLDRVAIFARMLPAQKFRIVRGLQARKHVVAMTGDGINDAPALRVADIGVAMGRRGTQVAREAATMVLMDDNFGTIVEAIRQGRRIFDNLQRAFLYLMTFHFPIVLGALLIPLAGAPLLLLPIHLVWLELIVHPTSALVFESDPPDPDLMQRPPRDPRQPLITRGTALRVAAEGVAIFLGVLGVYLWSLASTSPLNQARAAGVATLVFAQTILVLQSRSPRQAFWQRGIQGNRFLAPAILATLASLGLMVYLPPLARAAQLTPPTAGQWSAALAVAVASTIGFEFLKTGGGEAGSRPQSRGRDRK